MVNMYLLTQNEVPGYRVGAGRARFFRPPFFLNYRINEYYLHVFSVYFLGY